MESIHEQRVPGLDSSFKYRIMFGNAIKGAKIVMCCQIASYLQQLYRTFKVCEKLQDMIPDSVISDRTLMYGQ